MPCPFCDPHIIKMQLLHESNTVHVIHNIRPANKGQCVITPKRHVTNIRELTPVELMDLIQTIQFVSQKYTAHMDLDGMNYGFNEGFYAGQTIEHFHFHIMPRINGDKAFLPEYHLFHRDPQTKKNLTPDALQPYIDEIKGFFL